MSMCIYMCVFKATFNELKSPNSGIPSSRDFHFLTIMMVKPLVSSFRNNGEWESVRSLETLNV